MAAQTLNVLSLRKGLGLSQPEFATKYGLNLSTLRQWEQGRYSPDGAARVLLAVIASDPNAVEKAIERLRGGR